MTHKTGDFFKLRQTAGFFESLLLSPADGIVITDTAQNIIFANDIFCNFFSNSRQNLLETCIAVWIDTPGPGHRNVFRLWNSFVTEVQKYGSSADTEFFVNTGSGTKHFSVNGSLVKEIDTEEPGTMISIWRDITLFKEVSASMSNACGVLSSC